MFPQDSEQPKYSWLCYWWMAVWHHPLIDIPRDEFYNLWVCSPQDPRSEHLSHHLHKNIWTCKIFYVNTPMSLIISESVWLFDCWANGNTQHLTTRGMFDGEELGRVLVITKNKYHDQGFRQSDKTRITHTHCSLLHSVGLSCKWLMTYLVNM